KPYLSHFQDRTIDVAEPLAAILEVAYGQDPIGLLKRRQEFTEALAISCRETNHYGDDIALLRAIEDRMSEEEWAVQPMEIAASCRSELADMDEHKVAGFLRRYGFEQKNIRRSEGPRKCFVITRQKLEDILKRYSNQ